ncbi:FHA domain-containing protein [Paraliomyxa miuraensis]|uniref:FHA domain-containing protein n=1 Tax=Paraliomyxa miuraensis TaxID=376150 RepID=UPI00225623B6|nr:FHA domain-containing protein [Paraliomyxa miuraensis]MCX4241206.1 hypothetical protein [Paraliomyxa miuraensis]
MRAYATLQAPDGALHELVHGDLVGRLWSAAMPLDDARVSEAHAMVSLREGELRLIALRGGLALRGRPVNEVVLRPGVEIVLARGLSIEVVGVHLPGFVLGLEGPSLPRQALPPVASIDASAGLRLQAGHVEHAAAWVWSTGASWRLRVEGRPPRSLEPGDQLELAGHWVRAVAIPLDAAGQSPTRAGGGVEAPLRLLANFDTVHVHREGAAVLVLGGVHARIISELVALGGPAHWTVLAGLLWPDDAPANGVRSRFDVTLSRLRRKLKDARVRADLVHTDGAGQVELLLYPYDVVEDRT